MATKKQEFRYNKRRGHYSYIYEEDGELRRNLLLSTKPQRKIKRDGKTLFVDNVKLDKHPNPKSNKDVWLINRRFVDKKNAFETNARKNWKFKRSDKIKVYNIINKK